MSPLARTWRVVLLSIIAVFFIPGVAASDLDLWWRVVSLVGLVTAVLAVRMLVGSVIIVRDEGLRVQKNWPHRRDIPWYRILEIGRAHV